jgi:hypothetical protein
MHAFRIVCIKGLVNALSETEVHLPTRVVIGSRRRKDQELIRRFELCVRWHQLLRGRVLPGGMDTAVEVAHTLERTLDIYSNLSASIGRIEAAFREGKIEKVRFRVTAATKANTALVMSKTKGNRTESLANVTLAVRVPFQVLRSIPWWLCAKE